MRNFTYLRPESLKQAATTLAKNGGSAIQAGGTAILGGGTDLLDLMKSEIATPERVLNLKALPEPELRQIAERDGKLHVGALITLRELAESDLLKNRYPVLQEAAAAAASPQLRNAGTLGGNLCQRPRCWYFRDPEFPCLRKGGDTCFAVGGRNKFHCVVGGGPCYIVHPSDPAVALQALGAEVRVRRGGKTRSVPIGEFFVLPETDHEQETVLGGDEVVLGVEVPTPSPATRSSYTKFKFRESWDFAVVSVALVLETAGGTVRGGQIALGGVAPVPWLDAGASARLAGLTGVPGAAGTTGEAGAAGTAGGVGSNRGLDAFAAAVLADAEPLEENGFKVPLARNLARRAVAELLSRPGG
jgi:xanthine dehydrogenase YagS FAD-binding subunit